MNSLRKVIFLASGTAPPESTVNVTLPPDLRLRRLIAQDGGRIGLTELLVGVPFPSIAMEIMRCATAPLYFSDVILSPASYVPAEAMERGLIDNTVDAGILLDRARALAALPPAAFATTKHEIRQAALERAKLDAYPRSSRSGPPPIRSIASAITSPAPWGRKLSPSRLHPATRPTGRRPPHTRSGARRVAATTKVAQDALVGSDPAAGAPS